MLEIRFINFLQTAFRRPNIARYIRSYGQPTAATHPHLLKAGEVTPGITQSEYKQRRNNLMESIMYDSSVNSATTGHLVIIPAATKLYMTADIPYFFHQNSDFLYFSGFLEPDSLLILRGDKPNLPEYSTTLFVPRRDTLKELWDGPRSGCEGARELTGIEDTRNTEELGAYFQKYAEVHRNFMVWYNYNKPVHVNFHANYISEFLDNCDSRSVENVTLLIHKLRILKSPAEADLMRTSCDITTDAFVETMKFSAGASVTEAQLQAQMDYECRLRGADYLAYPPVVAGGDRANVIHYVLNNQRIDPGDLILMDAGCEYHGYASDVTRTWPISGVFSDAQRVLYEMVLEIQKQCVNMCSDHERTLSSIYADMLTMLGKHLLSAGILKTPYTNEEQIARAAREFCPHHIGHYLGMDVHDTDEVHRNEKLQQGMVITIEPGIYVSRERTDAYEDFRGIGIRIEDDVLITESGHENLTHKCPKEIVDIEKVMQSVKSR